MPLNSTSLTSPPAPVLMEHCCRQPWETYLEPLKMAPGVWYVSGNDWVACYLIDTGDGLILIDTAMHETAYLMIENIRKLGYELTDIKKILLSHAHIDHIGGCRTMKELTGAKVYLGKRDLIFLHERKELHPQSAGLRDLKKLPGSTATGIFWSRQALITLHQRRRKRCGVFWKNMMT